MILDNGEQHQRGVGRTAWDARAVKMLALALISFGHFLPTPLAAADPETCPPSTARVHQVYKGGPGASFTPLPEVDPSAVSRPAAPPPVRLELRDTISVVVRNLNTLVEEQRCRGDGGAIVLFLDGRPVPGATAYPPSDPRQETLHFELRRSDTPADQEQSERLWTHLLSRPDFTPRIVPISVGLSTQYAIPSDAFVALTTIPLGWFVFWLSILLVSLVLFLGFVRNSWIIRDTAFTQFTGTRPYSLAKSQVAWWFFLALAAYLFIALVTGQWNTAINGTVLALLGIAGGTAIGSVAIDARDDTMQNQKKCNEAAEKIDKKKTELENKQPRSAEEEQQLSELRSALAKAKRHSEGWFTDVVSDADGVSFHRFQLVVLTFVLGIVFVHGVWRDLTMPEFDQGLLGLLGLSSLSYLGLKVTEPTAPQRQVPPAGDGGTTSADSTQGESAQATTENG
jgi:hypothetical protein